LPLQSEHTGSVEAVAGSPHGKLVASGGAGRVVKIWGRGTGVERGALHGHGGPGGAPAVTPGGQPPVSSRGGRGIRLWDVAAGRELPRQPGHAENFHNLLKPAPLVQVTPDGKGLLAWIPGSERHTTVAVFDLASGKEVVAFNDRGRDVTAVAFTADGKQAGGGGRDGRARV